MMWGLPKQIEERFAELKARPICCAKCMEDFLSGRKVMVLVEGIKNKETVEMVGRRFQDILSPNEPVVDLMEFCFSRKKKRHKI